jgi:carbamate kinase
MSAPLVVVALGGNALLRRGEPPEPGRELERARAAAEALAPLSSAWRLVITHGNGPQVGLLATQQRDVPLDILGAQTEGAIGHELTLGLRDALPDRQIATLVTQTLVDAADPAFDHPTKPIGAMLDPDAVAELQRAREWTIARDGDGWRRVVASPEPLAVLEHQVVRLLADADVVVVCAGGGGIPVVRDGTRHRGVEAVVDKDLASARLAVDVGAAALVLLTDVAAVQTGWGTPQAQPLATIDRATAAALGLAAGSMGPKVEAGLRFAEATGGLAAIGALDDAAAVVAGRAGTRCIAATPSTIEGAGPCVAS